MATKGYSSPELLQAYARARELCQQVGETPQLFQVLRGVWYFYLHRVELRTARELGSSSSPWPSVSAIRRSSWRPTMPSGTP